MFCPSGLTLAFRVAEVCVSRVTALLLNAPSPLGVPTPEVPPTATTGCRTSGLRLGLVLGRVPVSVNKRKVFGKIRDTSDGGVDLQRRVGAVALGRLAADTDVELEPDRVDQVDQGVEGRIGALAAQEPRDRLGLALHASGELRLRDVLPLPDRLDDLQHFGDALDLRELALEPGSE